MNTPAFLLRRRAHEIRMLGPAALAVFVISWTILITWLSSQPSRKDDPSGLATHLLFNTGHAPLYGIWAAGFAFFLGARTRRPTPGTAVIFVAIVAAGLYGTMDEIHQCYVPGRTGSWTDVVTDTVGASVALFCIRRAGGARATLASIFATLALGVCAMIGCGALATWMDNLSK